MSDTGYRSVASAPAKQNDEQPTTLGGWIERMKPELARALPSHLKPERLARIATTALRTTPRLAETTPQSFLGALLTAAQLGLEPNTPLGECWLLPYRVKNKQTDRYELVAQYIQGYQGLVTLGYRSGQVAGIIVEVVHDADEFEFGIGDNPFITHKPSLAEDLGPVIAVYAVVEMKDGAKVRKIMSPHAIERIRQTSQSPNSPAWRDHWEAMAKKTVFKQAAKWMPKSPELMRLHLAATVDESVRTDIGELMDAQPAYIDGEVEAAVPDTDDQQPVSETSNQGVSETGDQQPTLDGTAPGDPQSTAPPSGGDTGQAEAPASSNQRQRRGGQK